jgi:hypothetical protein
MLVRINGAAEVIQLESEPPSHTPMKKSLLILFAACIVSPLARASFDYTNESSWWQIVTYRVQKYTYKTYYDYDAAGNELGVTVDWNPVSEDTGQPANSTTTEEVAVDPEGGQVYGDDSWEDDWDYGDRLDSEGNPQPYTDTYTETGVEYEFVDVRDL